MLFRSLRSRGRSTPLRLKSTPPSPYPRHGHARLPACFPPIPLFLSSQREEEEEARLVTPLPEWEVGRSRANKQHLGGWVGDRGDCFARPAPSFDPADRSQSNPIQSNNLLYFSSPAAGRRLRFAWTSHPVGWILESFSRSIHPSGEYLTIRLLVSSPFGVPFSVSLPRLRWLFLLAVSIWDL